MRPWRRTITPIAMAAGSLMLAAVTAAPARRGIGGPPAGLARDHAARRAA